VPHSTSRAAATFASPTVRSAGFGTSRARLWSIEPEPCQSQSLGRGGEHRASPTPNIARSASPHRGGKVAENIDRASGAAHALRHGETTPATESAHHGEPDCLPPRPACPAAPDASRWCSRRRRAGATRPAFRKSWQHEYQPDWIAGVSIGAITRTDRRQSAGTPGRALFGVLAAMSSGNGPTVRALSGHGTERGGASGAARAASSKFSACGRQMGIPASTKPRVPPAAPPPPPAAARRLRRSPSIYDQRTAARHVEADDFDLSTEEVRPVRAL